MTDAEPETSMPSLALGSLDMVLADQYPFLPRAPDPRLDLEPLHEEQFHIVLPVDHPLAARTGAVPIAALKDEPWAIGKDDTAYAELTIRACRTFGGFEPDVRHRSNDLLMLLALVSNGQAVTLLPDLVRADREPSVVTRDVAEAPLHAHGLRRDPPRQRAAAGAQCTASGAAGHGGWPSVGSHARTLKPPGARGGREPAAERGRQLGDLVQRRAGAVVRRPARPARPACTRSRPSPSVAVGRGQRVAHHAVGAAVDDPGTRRGSPARSSATGIARRADQGLYVVQAGHAGRFYGPSLRRL